jgi:1,4-alpha-glucan branching enzyme
MTADQASRKLSRAIWIHFSKWAAEEACIVSRHRKGREVQEYSEQRLDEYLKRLFRPWGEHTEEQYGSVLPLGSRVRRQRVEFALKAPRARSVTVAGSFNDWDPARTSLRKGKDGVWRRTLLLSHGRYVYRFVVDGEWRSDPKAKESAPNEFGETNSVVEV